MRIAKDRDKAPASHAAPSPSHAAPASQAAPAAPAPRAGGSTTALYGAPARVRQRAPHSAPNVAAWPGELPCASANVKPAAKESPQP